MKFHVPINVPVDGGSQTIHIVDTGSNCASTNKRKLKEYFIEMGVPRKHLKRVMKAMGFWGKSLENIKTSNSCS